MENLLLLLPRRPQSIFVRYGVTTLIVLVCFALQIGVEFQSGMFTFFLLLPGIFLGLFFLIEAPVFTRPSSAPHCALQRFSSAKVIGNLNRKDRSRD
jgi:hypothetical protein